MPRGEESPKQPTGFPDGREIVGAFTRLSGELYSSLNCYLAMHLMDLTNSCESLCLLSYIGGSQHTIVIFRRPAVQVDQ